MLVLGLGLVLDTSSPCLSLVLKSLGLALMPLNACTSRCIVTDAHSHIGNVNKIPHVNDFTYLQYFYCRQKDFASFRCLVECILGAVASSDLVERVLFLRVG